MTETTHCDDCGARNAADARWCTQCYRSLVDDNPTGHDDVAPSAARSAGMGAPASPLQPPPAAIPRSSPRPAPAPARDGLLPLPPGDGLLPLPPQDVSPAEPAVLRTGDGRFRRAADGLEWSCEVCERWNPLERTTCVVCGASFLAPAEEPEPAREVEPVLLLGATVALPGAGHALLGLWAQAFFRGLLALVWGVGGLSLLVDALAAGQPVLPAVPLLVGWLLLAAASVNDVLVAAGGPGRVLLQGRTVLWLVLAVIGATVAAAFVGALAAVGG